MRDPDSQHALMLLNTNSLITKTEPHARQQKGHLTCFLTQSPESKRNFLFQITKAVNTLAIIKPFLEGE